MQIIKSLVKLLFFLSPALTSAQTTFLNQGSKDAHFIDRLEIKQQKNTDLNFSALRPFSRRAIVAQAEFIDSARMGYTDSAGRDKYKEWNTQDLSDVDEYNLQHFLMNNSEWVSSSKKDFLSKKPLVGSLYKTKANLLEVNQKDFFLALNPVLQFEGGKESANNETLFINTRGLTARGTIARKIAFSTYLTDNQERGPLFYQQRVNSTNAVPGVGFYKPFKSTGYDFFDARGYISFNATKYIDIQFGYDKNFIGNGYRSLFLSDWGNSYLFLKLNTKIWKFNYQNLFMELMPQFRKAGDTLLDRKYAVMHHLSMNVSKWLNIGVFEAVIFGRRNHFDFEYLNPIIFYRSIEGNVGSPDNALVGLDFKGNLLHHVQFYGQFLLDEFVLSAILRHPYNWVNKWGIQAGVKYMDAFGISNLDLQVETNRVRPFTYSHYDSVSNYTHYNQPLAHPLGANFQEFIGIINYQPKPKWYINLKAIYYQQGLDSAGKNYGGNIFEDYRTRSMDDGFKVAGGNKATCLMGFLQVSYEWKENLFFDLNLQYRSYKTALAPKENNTTVISAGLRLNMFRRDHDF